MSQQQVSQLSKATISQYAFYMFIGFIIWVSGVVLVRLLGELAFAEGSSLLILLYVVSIPLGVVTMYVTRIICRVPMNEMLTPVLVMLFTTLMLDGFAVGFTQLYGETNEMVRYAGGWLLWTFGAQIVVTMLMVKPETTID